MYDSLLLTSFFLRLANKPSALQHHQVPLLTWKRKPSSPQPLPFFADYGRPSDEAITLCRNPISFLRYWGLNSVSITVFSCILYIVKNNVIPACSSVNISTFSTIKFNCRVRCIAHFLPYSYLETTSQLSPHAHLQLWLFCACPISVLKRRNLLSSGHRARPSIRPEILLLFQYSLARSN